MATGPVAPPSFLLPVHKQADYYRSFDLEKTKESWTGRSDMMWTCGSPRSSSAHSRVTAARVTPAAAATTRPQQARARPVTVATAVVQGEESALQMFKGGCQLSVTAGQRSKVEQTRGPKIADEQTDLKSGHTSHQRFSRPFSPTLFLL